MVDPWEAKQGEYQRSLIVLRSVQDRLVAALGDATNFSEGQQVTVHSVRVPTVLPPPFCVRQTSWEGPFWRVISERCLAFRDTSPTPPPTCQAPKTIWCGRIE